MKILVIGAGSIGRRHSLNAAALGEAAVIDLDKEKANNIAEEAGISFFSTMEEARNWKPDGIIIATPNNTHVDIASEVIEWGATLLIEKPISHSVEKIEHLLNKSENLGVDIYVVTNMRFHPAVIALKSNLSEIGKSLFARAHYGNFLPNMRPGIDYRKLYAANRNQGGGVILDAVHEIDYLYWLFGPGVEVTASADKLSELDIDVEDYASMVITHKNGIRSEIHLDYLRQFKRRGCEIVGTKGTLIWQSEGKQPEQCMVKIFHSDSQEWEILFETHDLDNTSPYLTLMKQFTSAIQGKEH
ncbi:MAG TPA: Gfo/Idh/MocA family oxidoreductase, partial [Gammaproteobacteria bacterium]|nr:Gfo/Idh/MocA family oxidoreductase [Gammaproteobacteria bacterium]